MCDDAIEKASEVLGPLCAQFGLRPPLPSKFKAPRSYIYIYIYIDTCTYTSSGTSCHDMCIS